MTNYDERIALLGKYMSGDDDVLSNREFIKVFADRINDDLEGKLVMKSKYEEITEVFDAITEASYFGPAFKQVLMEKPEALEAAKNLAAAIKNLASSCKDYAEDVCTDGGKHDPDQLTVSPADGVPGVLDINCSKCGTSGAFRADEPGLIDW